MLWFGVYSGQAVAVAANGMDQLKTPDTALLIARKCSFTSCKLRFSRFGDTCLRGF